MWHPSTTALGAAHAKAIGAGKIVELLSPVGEGEGEEEDVFPSCAKFSRAAANQARKSSRSEKCHTVARESLVAGKNCADTISASCASSILNNIHSRPLAGMVDLACREGGQLKQIQLLMRTGLKKFGSYLIWRSDCGISALTKTRATARLL
jgi:hypothetical protein